MKLSKSLEVDFKAYFSTLSLHVKTDITAAFHEQREKENYLCLI